MKPATIIEPDDAHQALLREFDLREIDNPQARAAHRLKYMARLNAVLRAVQRAVPAGGRVLEVGCSQANASLLLAEQGYRAVAVDLLPAALAYARKKYQYGQFMPVVGNAAQLPCAPGSFDAVILGELLEHCSQPPLIISQALDKLRPAGLLVVTTPNRSLRSGSLPTYGEFEPSTDSEHHQYGPHGDHHLFVFTAGQLRRLLADCGLQNVRLRLIGCPVMSDRFFPLKRLLPLGVINLVSDLVCNVPIVGPKVAYTLMATGRKSSHERSCQ